MLLSYWVLRNNAETFFPEDSSKYIFASHWPDRVWFTFHSHLVAGGRNRTEGLHP